MDSAISLLMLVAQKPEFFTAERVLNLMGKTNDFTLIRDYLDDELDLYDSERVEAWLASAEADMPDGLPKEEIVAVCAPSALMQNNAGHELMSHYAIFLDQQRFSCFYLAQEGWEAYRLKGEESLECAQPDQLAEALRN
jgi:hypothetical protein